MCTARRWVVLLVAWAGTACAHNSAPPGFLPDPREAQTEATGAWIELTRGPAPEGRVRGELFAVTEDTVWVRVLSDTVLSVPTASVTGGQMVEYDSQYGRVGAATLLGTLSTISNGFFLVLTAPLWILGGTLGMAAQSRAPVHRLPPGRWTDLVPFARFPQGLPTRLEPIALRRLPPPSAGLARERWSTPPVWLWVSGAEALGTGADKSRASVVGVNAGYRSWTVRGRAVAWGGPFDHVTSHELGLLVGFRPPGDELTYEVALGHGWYWYWYPWQGTAGPVSGLAFSAAVGWPARGPVGLKLETFGNVNGTRSFVGLGLSLELGWRPSL